MQTEFPRERNNFADRRCRISGPTCIYSGVFFLSALTLTIAHQYLDQLPDDLQAAVFGNVGSIAACRTGATDAALVCEQIGLASSSALLDLPNFTAWARLIRRGVPSSPIRLDLFDAPSARRQDLHRLIDTSRMRFGRPRAEVEARIARFLGSP